jgi:hypothetical protein
MSNTQQPKIIPEAGMAGYLLRRELLVFLEWERAEVAKQNQNLIIKSLKEILGQSHNSANISSLDWERLAEATLTIGSKAIDRISFRLRSIGQNVGWDSNIDYRSLASVLHAGINQGRKLKNVSALRGKCVKAIIEKFELANVPARDRLSDIVSRSNFQKWADELFRVFVESATVKPQFHYIYKTEWESFIEDAENYFFQTVDPWSTKKTWPEYSKLKPKYEKFLETLMSDASKTNLNWAFEKVSSSGMRDDIVINNGVTINLKRRPEYFSFTVKIPSNFKSNFSEIPLALMDLLENNPGFQHVDIAQIGNESNQIEIQIFDKYEMKQINEAQNEILNYFKRRFN